MRRSWLLGLAAASMGVVIYSVIRARRRPATFAHEVLLLVQNPHDQKFDVHEEIGLSREQAAQIYAQWLEVAQQSPTPAAVWAADCGPSPCEMISSWVHPQIPPDILKR